MRLIGQRCDWIIWTDQWKTITRRKWCRGARCLFSLNTLNVIEKCARPKYISCAIWDKIWAYLFSRYSHFIYLLRHIEVGNCVKYLCRTKAETRDMCAPRVSLILHRLGIAKCAITIDVMHKNYRFASHYQILWSTRPGVKWRARSRVVVNCGLA